MNKQIPIVLGSTCVLSIAVACASKVHEPQPPPVLLTPAAGTAPTPAATMPAPAPQGAKVTPIDTIGRPVEATSSMGGAGGDAGVIPQGYGGTSGHAGHGGSGGNAGSR